MKIERGKGLASLPSIAPGPSRQVDEDELHVRPVVQEGRRVATGGVVVSRTVKSVVPSGVRMSFAPRSKYGSLNPRSCGAPMRPCVTAPSRLLWTLIVSRAPSPHIQTNARSSVPGAQAVTANSIRAPRPESSRAPFRSPSPMSVTYEDGSSTFELPEKATAPWPGVIGSRPGSTMTHHGFDPLVAPAIGVKVTSAPNVCGMSRSIRVNAHFAWSFGLPGIRVTDTPPDWTPSVNTFRETVFHSLPDTRRHRSAAMYTSIDFVSIVGSWFSISTGMIVWVIVGVSPGIATAEV